MRLKAISVISHAAAVTDIDTMIMICLSISWFLGKVISVVAAGEDRIVIVFVVSGG